MVQLLEYLLATAPDLRIVKIGKTKLLETIPLCLFGPSLPWSEYLAAGEEDCRVELEFEHGGERYRVRRTYSAKGRGRSTLDFERLTRSSAEA